LTKIAELHITPVQGRGIAFILSFPTPDQIEGDTKDAIYHTAGDRLYPVIPDPRSSRG